MNSRLLDGKVALITGAGSNPGMGRIMAHAMIRAGARVAISDVREEPLAESVNDAREIGDEHSAIGIVSDVSKPEDAARAIKETIEQLGALHILVNNAGISLTFENPLANRGPNFWEVAPETWERMVSVNLGGAFLMSRAAVPQMIEQGWGRIISVTTSLDTMIRGRNAPYGPSKAGHEALVATMAHDLAGTGVTANVLVPGGATNTNFIPFSSDRDRSSFIDPNVMAAPAVWLASEEANDINGMRFIGNNWDTNLSGRENVPKAGGPAAWPQLGRPERAR